MMSVTGVIFLQLLKWWQRNLQNNLRRTLNFWAGPHVKESKNILYKKGFRAYLMPTSPVSYLCRYLAPGMLHKMCCTSDYHLLSLDLLVKTAYDIPIVSIILCIPYPCFLSNTTIFLSYQRVIFASTLIIIITCAKYTDQVLCFLTVKADETNCFFLTMINTP